MQFSDTSPAEDVLDVGESAAEGESAADSAPVSEAKPKRKRGFSAMSAERHKVIASQGGLASHAKGTAYRFTPEKAKEAATKAAEKRRQNSAARRAALLADSGVVNTNQEKSE